MSNKEKQLRLQIEHIEHTNRSFLENVIHYYGDVLNRVLVVGGVFRSVQVPLLFFVYFIYYFPVTVRSNPLLFLMSVLSNEVYNSTNIMSHYKMT